jgi:protoporphyrinogen oxidase
MTWLWNKIHLRFASRRGGPQQREVLGYLTGSFDAYISALISRIRELGGELIAGRPVERIAVRNGRAEALVVREPDETIAFDAIISTVANRILLRLCDSLPDDYAAKLSRIQYEDALCLVLTLKRPLSNVYWLNVNDRSIPFLALVEHTNLIDKSQYGGQHLLYISNYLEKGANLLKKDIDEIYDLYVPHLKRINPSFSEEWIQDRWLFRGPDAQPVFTVGSAESIPEHRTAIENLYVANMSQIYPEDRGQNYSIRLGERVARMIIERTPGANDPVGAHTT